MRSILINKIFQLNYCKNINSNRFPITKLKKIWEKRFPEKNISDTPGFLLRNFISKILKKDLREIPEEFGNLQLTENELAAIEQMCEAKLARVPLQYIVGEWEFRNFKLKMLPTVFIPRPETENLIDIIIENISVKSESYKILEIGCGTGAISIALLKELENSNILALDRSNLACTLAMENTIRCNVNGRFKVIQHLVEEENLVPYSILNEKYDLIVSNPPYIKTSLLHSLDPEVYLYENLNALDGGPDGLKIIRLILRIAENNLFKNGKLYLEIDSSQIDLIKKVINMKHETTLEFVKYYTDIFEKDRFAEIIRK